MFDGDPFMEDPEVGVLEGAVGVLKNACVLEMSRMNITDLSDWPFARVVLPDFFWTNIEHQLDPDMYPDGLFWEAPLYDGDLFWLHHLYRKFSTALYRNKYRLDEYTDWRSIVRNSGTIQYMTAASNEIVQHTRKFGCLSQRPPKARLDRLCEQESMSPTAIVVDFSNASLSLWINGPESEWMPWNTFPELGAHATAGCHRLDFKDQVKVLTSHLQPVADQIHALIDNFSRPEGSPMNFVLSGEAWSEASQAAFKDLVSKHEGVEKQIGSGKYMRQTDEFAASKRVARWARYHVKEAFHCTLPVDVNVPEVPWDTLTGHDEL